MPPSSVGRLLRLIPLGALRSQSRAGFAALLSVSILIAALVAQRGLRGGRDPVVPAGPGRPAPTTGHPTPLTAQIKNLAPPPATPPPAAIGRPDPAELPPTPIEVVALPVTGGNDPAAASDDPPGPFPRLSSPGDPDAQRLIPPAPALATQEPTPPPLDEDPSPPLPQAEGETSGRAAPAAEAPGMPVILAATEPPPTTLPDPMPPPAGPSADSKAALPIAAAPPPAAEAAAANPPKADAEAEPSPSLPADPAADALLPPMLDSAPPKPSPEEAKPQSPPANKSKTGPAKPAKTQAANPTHPRPVPAAPAASGASPPAGSVPPTLPADLPAFSPLPTDPESFLIPAVTEVAGWPTVPNAAKRRPAGPPHDEADETTTAAGEVAAAPQGEERIVPVAHVVRRGENFWTISRLYYGTGRFYKALWAANRATVPVIERLTIGTTIEVPPPEALERSLVERPEPPAAESISSPPRARQDRRTGRPPAVTLVLPVGDPSTEAGSFVAAAAGPPAEAWPAVQRPVHTVRRGENLRTIARDRLGDAHRTDEILRLNRDVIRDPHRLTPDLSLRLPADAFPNRVVR